MDERVRHRLSKRLERNALHPFPGSARNRLVPEITLVHLKCRVVLLESRAALAGLAVEQLANARAELHDINAREAVVIGEDLPGNGVRPVYPEEPESPKGVVIEGGQPEMPHEALRQKRERQIGAGGPEFVKAEVLPREDQPAELDSINLDSR